MPSVNDKVIEGVSSPDEKQQMISGSTDHDHTRLMWDESTDIASFLDEMDDADFDEASLCEGWRVRDVLSHMILGHTTSAPRLFAQVTRYGANVPRASRELSRKYGSAHSPEELRRAWSTVVEGRVAKGIARAVPGKEVLADHLIHHQDMRRPLDRARVIPPERLSAVLDALPTIGGFLGSKKRMKGLRWTATDLDWSWGEGPEVTGAAEPLILAAGGRPFGGDELSGEGVDTLRARL
jgi:uncharacterized protein (TIGR03083 family)